MAAPDSYLSNPHLNSLADFLARRRAASREVFRGLTAGAKIVADALTFILGIVVAYLIPLHFSSSMLYPMQKVVAVGALEGLLGVLLLQGSGAYSGGGSLLRIRETERALQASIQSLLLLLLANLLLRFGIPFAALACAALLVPLLLIGQKQIFCTIARHWHAKGYGVDRIVVCSAGDAGKSITSPLLYSPDLGLRLVALIGEDLSASGDPIVERGYSRCHAVPIHRGPVTARLLKSLQCNLLVVAMPEASPRKLMELIRVADQAGAPVAFLPSQAQQERLWLPSMDSDSQLLPSTIEPLTSWSYLLAKRLLDLVVSTLLLVVLSPLLGLIALLIQLSSSGPVIFVQKRVGRNGACFDMYKFRSMHATAPRYEVSPKHSSDPRINTLGRLLRRSSLDELPQLINVFLGNMSLVGPRPEMPFLVAGYSAHQRRRLQVTPGMTGLWQVSADRVSPIHENIEHDLYYISHRTFFMDLAILIHTLVFAVGGGV